MTPLWLFPISIYVVGASLYQSLKFSFSTLAAVMARSALSALLAVASLAYVAAQSLTSPATSSATPLPTFPATPLANLQIPYADVVRIPCCGLISRLIIQFIVALTLLSHIKLSPVNMLVALSLATISVILQLKTSSHSVRPQLSIASLVHSFWLFFGAGLMPYSDFCVFAPPLPNSTIGDTEGEEVCWCTKRGHGCRGIPPGTITGIQVLNTHEYMQIVALIDQSNINMARADSGGELDPHGQDLVRCTCGLGHRPLSNSTTLSWATPSARWCTGLISAQTNKLFNKYKSGTCSFAWIYISSNTKITFIGLWVGTSRQLRSATRQVPTPPATAKILLTALVWHTICLIRRRMVHLKYATLILWIFPVSTPRADKHSPTFSPLSPLALSQQSRTHLAFLLAPTA
jgi:hypothetical protein